ncbi:hypothetical protein FFLO_01941 [Filobasidium floriforme]|uniref:NAD(P)-binding protein n=1 Tax=Filobasidium floriforme TaxID=5210 RepID=A0A8K0JP21_9TREE|nr:uncharacterized protein HD553DRAFT_93339 [Filobasidium floriforme]KAG7562674.1 hypothetical protein FFLO_01941 [Filobasidium floriforme]KAH8089484.1 hypothetical protein HD553DRAFT_93339 [Filobasidium floriforme]
MSQRIAVILGAGPGAGAGIARAFSKTHNVALLSRNPATLSKTQSSLPSTSTSHPFPADASDPASISSAWEAIKSHWPEGTIDVAIFNAPGGGFSPGGFLSKTPEHLERGLKAGVLGAFAFAQLFLKEAKEGTLIFTGATAALRGGANFSTLSPDKFALRSLSQTLAREFGPKNIHVAHTIIDGLIDTDRVASFAGEAKEADGRISPDEIGKAYVYLHEQARSAWTQELDLRPFTEKF